MFNKPLFSQLGASNYRRLYECLNPQCFYCETLLKTEEASWKEQWNSEIDDLDMRPVCPSCSEPLAFWDYETEAEMLREKKEVEHGKTTKKNAKKPS